jgi:hypothetical protein
MPTLWLKALPTTSRTYALLPALAEEMGYDHEPSVSPTDREECCRGTGL